MKEKPAQLPVSPQEVQIQAPSILDKLKIHKGKILGGILGVLVFTGAVFGAYKVGQRQVQPGPWPTPTPGAVATPTPDPTANWKTYTNTKYGYLIKYPTDWVLQPDKQTPEEIVNFGKDLYSLSIYAGSASTGVPSGVTPSEISSVTIAGQEATREVYEGLKILVKFPEELEVNQIVMSVEYSETFNLMFSTFKFTSEEAVGEKVFCKDPRPEVCTMECITNPPYICGSDGKSYCSICQACADPKVEWYIIQDKPCEAK